MSSTNSKEFGVKILTEDSRMKFLNFPANHQIYEQNLNCRIKYTPEGTHFLDSDDEKVLLLISPNLETIESALINILAVLYPKENNMEPSYDGQMVEGPILHIVLPRYDPVDKNQLAAELHCKVDPLNLLDHQKSNFKEELIVRIQFMEKGSPIIPVSKTAMKIINQLNLAFPNQNVIDYRVLYEEDEEIEIRNAKTGHLPNPYITQSSPLQSHATPHMTTPQHQQQQPQPQPQLYAKNSPPANYFPPGHPPAVPTSSYVNPPLPSTYNAPSNTQNPNTFSDNRPMDINDNHVVRRPAVFGEPGFTPVGPSTTAAAPPSYYGVQNHELGRISNNASRIALANENIIKTPCVVYMKVSNEVAGAIIGVGGSIIKELTKGTGAQINVYDFGTGNKFDDKQIKIQGMVNQVHLAHHKIVSIMCTMKAKQTNTNNNNNSVNNSANTSLPYSSNNNHPSGHNNNHHYGYPNRSSSYGNQHHSHNPQQQQHHQDHDRHHHRPSSSSYNNNPTNPSSSYPYENQNNNHQSQMNSSSNSNNNNTGGYYEEEQVIRRSSKGKGKGKGPSNYSNHSKPY